MHIEADLKNCFGCSACMVVCPAKAIEMREDGEGFKSPCVDRSKCIECGLCVNVCPEKNKENQPRQPLKVYATKSEDDSRYKSSSGALFPAFAQYYIDNLNGYVCGCVLESMYPKHIVSNDTRDIDRMRGSKYVQSDLNGCFEQISDLLKAGKNVLFTGTSCQVAGLHAALSQKKIDTSGLLTIDFFCHGVPSPKIWMDYLIFYQKVKKRYPIDFQFRKKKYGWGISDRGSYCLTSMQYRGGHGSIKTDDVSWAARMWRSVFFSNICLRQSCHQCPYASIDKPADITMGDFWGIEQVAPEFDDGKGCSVAILRSNRALGILENIKMEKIQVTIDQAVRKQPCAFAPSKANVRRQEFWNDYNENGFEYVAKKYFKYNYQYRIRAFIKRILFEIKMIDLY